MRRCVILHLEKEKTMYTGAVVLSCRQVSVLYVGTWGGRAAGPRPRARRRQDCQHRPLQHARERRPVLPPGCTEQTKNEMGEQGWTKLANKRRREIEGRFIIIIIIFWRVEGGGRREKKITFSPGGLVFFFFILRAAAGGSGGSEAGRTFSPARSASSPAGRNVQPLPRA